MNQEAGQFFDHRDVSNNYPNEENQSNPNDYMEIRDLCEKHLHHYVMGHLNDGRMVEGIIMNVDDESVTILVVDTDDMTIDGDTRQFGRFPRNFRFRPFRFRFPFFRRPFFTPFIFPFFWI